jgi:glycosyltransferase involved in cell wall biosynthesis
MEVESGPAIAYIVKEFPQLADTFIADELHLLESMGLTLRIYSIMGEEHSTVHHAAAPIRAPVTYLLHGAGSSSRSFLSWLYLDLFRSVASHLRLVVHRPRAYLTTVASVIARSRKLRPIPIPGRGKALLEEFLQAVEIAVQIVIAADVGHLHGHACHSTATVTWLVSRLTGLPFSFSAHARDTYDSDLHPADPLRPAISGARFVTTCSATIRRHLAEVCPEYRAVHTVYRGLDVDYFSPQPRPSETAGPIILSVGQFVEGSGFEYLIAACAQLKAAGLHFSCWLVGPEGADSKRIRRTIETLGVSDVVSTYGAVTRTQLRYLFRHASAFVLPLLQLQDSDPGGIPHVLTQAMSMGTPVIATAISGIPELIENDTNGLCVPERDSRSLARSLQALLQSAALRRRLGQAARQTVCRNFDLRRTTGRLRDLFLNAFQDARESPVIVQSEPGRP